MRKHSSVHLANGSVSNIYGNGSSRPGVRVTSLLPKEWQTLDINTSVHSIFHTASACSLDEELVA